MLAREGEDELGVAAFVLHDQEPAARQPGGGDIRQAHPEGRALPYRALEVDRPAMELDEPLGEREAEAGPVRVGPILVHPLELPEHAVVTVGRDADPGVADLDQ